ncbi:MAG: histidine kinase [Tannerella sp.]|jgi:sensor histidine kinase YesM|nr:histidine kinase [Tannerella sp.]
MKNNKQIQSPLNHKLAIFLSLNFGLLLAFFIFIGLIFSEKNINDFSINQTTIINLVVHFFTVVFTIYFLFEYCFWAFRKKLKLRKKALLAFCGVFLLAIPISLVFSNIVIYLFQIVPDDFHNRLIFLNLIKDLVISLIAFLTTQFITMLIHNRQVLLENQQLIAENTKNRFEALKNQLDPHFLFNTLNTLDGLIGFDDEKAHSYLQNLSSSFRYTIQNKEITTLKEELDFVESYAFLMKIRYGDNLSIQYAVDDKYNNFHIMPVSLQLLIENAIKHNVINDKHPLTLFIETTENDTVKVSNTIQPKINAEAGEGIGLANLVERYRLLFRKEVVITQNGVFSVEIPLIKEINHS